MFTCKKASVYVDPDIDRGECWKSFNTAHCISLFKEATSLIKLETVHGKI